MPDVERLSEPLKFLPIAYVLFTVGGLWVIYMGLHCLPKLQAGVKPEYLDPGLRKQGLIELAVFNYLFLIFMACYMRSIFTHPGEVPNTSQWEYTSAPDRWHHLVREKKKTGDRRHCKWCGKYKPDRCHHCRVCRTCILRMDHHCPWIYNCVGFHNYKYFFLLVLYALLSCQFIFWTMMQSVIQSVIDGLPFATMFFLFFGETLTLFLSLILGSFWSFHVYLMFKAMTTIEYCEKAMPRAAQEGEASADFNATQYDRGLVGNVCSVLGDTPLAWFLPCSPPSGDGLTYDTDESPFTTRSFETHRSIKARRNRNTQKYMRTLSADLYNPERGDRTFQS